MEIQTARIAETYGTSPLREHLAEMSGMLNNIDWGPLVAGIQGIARNLEACRPMLQRMRVEMACAVNSGGITYCADDDGYVSVDGYSEEIHWFRGLLALRYGEELLSPIVHPEGQNARFTFFSGRLLSQNPRWQMYAGIG